MLGECACERLPFRGPGQSVPLAVPAQFLRRRVREGSGEVLPPGPGGPGQEVGHQEERRREPGSGYVAAGSPDAQGGTDKGFGSKGGSYNDEYDAATANQSGGSPARGDYNQQDAARNYGGAAADRNPSDNSADYGPAPGRTASAE